jgi:hypothetical protein
MDIKFIFNRVKNLIVSPKEEWGRIHKEDYTKNEILLNYALPLLIIIVICSIIGDIIFASRFLFSFMYVLTKAIIMFVVAFVSMYFSAIIINEITTSFNSKKNIHGTFKLVVYSFTAYLITSAFTNLLPPLGISQLFALYSIYLFWIGTSIVLETPEDNKVGFVVVSGLIMAGIYTVVYLILGKVLTGIFAVTL